MIDIVNLFVKHIYGDHNSSKRVVNTLNNLLNELPENGVGLNVGSGRTYLDRRIKNLEISDGPNIDYVGSAGSISVSDDVFDLVISQEVLEHLQDPFLSMKEMRRVLRTGGRCSIQIPFIIGYHPCPNDYWRFTKEGIVSLAEKAGFKVIVVGESVGSATGYYRIGVEFFSILLSVILPKGYRAYKALFALLLNPIKWLAPLLSLSKQSERVSGGYFIVCENR